MSFEERWEDYPKKAQFRCLSSTHERIRDYLEDAKIFWHCDITAPDSGNDAYIKFLYIINGILLFLIYKKKLCQHKEQDF